MWFFGIQLDSSLLLGGAIAVASVSSVQAADQYVLGVCQTATQSDGAEIRPTYAADSYLSKYRRGDRRYKRFSFEGSKTRITLIEAPKHGELALVDDADEASSGFYNYLSNQGYVGRDRFVMLVEKGDVKVRIEYLIEGLNDNEPTTFIGDDGKSHGIYCHPEHWKISLDNGSGANF